MQSLQWVSSCQNAVERKVNDLTHHPTVRGRLLKIIYTAMVSTKSITGQCVVWVKNLVVLIVANIGKRYGNARNGTRSAPCVSVARIGLWWIGTGRLSATHHVARMVLLAIVTICLTHTAKDVYIVNTTRATTSRTSCVVRVRPKYMQHKNHLMTNHHFKGYK